MLCCGEKKTKDGSPKTVTIFIGFFFLVNFVLGAGFLGIPFTFFHGGVLAGSLTLILICFLAWTTASYEVETMARAQAVVDLHNGLYDKTQTSGIPDFRVKDTRKFEITELCHIFVGRWFKILYISVMVVHGLLTLVTYSTVAASAWSVNIPFDFGSLRECTDLDFLHEYFPVDPECGNAYRFCLALFSAIVIPLSLLDLKEQAIVQFLLGVLRFFLLTSIIIYCLYHLISGDQLTVEDVPLVGDTNVTELYSEELNMTSIFDTIFHFSFDGWVVGIPVIFYAILLHQGIPSLVHPIKEKKWLKGCFELLFIVIGGFYLVVSFLGAIWFRNIVNETFTLNWVPYTDEEYSIPLRIFSYFIILFPSIDVCSVFPLVVHAVTNNVYVVLFCRDTSQEKGIKPMLIQLVMKFVIAIIPIIIAMFISNLVYIIKFAGFVGFFHALLCPIVLQWASQWKCIRRFSFMSGETKKLELKKMGSKLSDSLGKDFVTEDDTNVQEDNPLIDEQQGNTTETGSQLFFWRKLKQFLFSCKDCALYHTPYSTIFSHPLSVVFVMIFSVIIFILSVVSIFFHPTDAP